MSSESVLRLQIGRGRRREPHDRCCDLQKIWIGQNSIFVGDRRRDALEIERELDAHVLVALIALQLLFDIIARCRRHRAGR